MAAKRRRKRKTATKRKTHHKGGHIPLKILERRARKLVAIVKKRGGSAP